MEPRGDHYLGLLSLLINLSIATTFLCNHCEARSSRQWKDSPPLVHPRGGEHQPTPRTSRALNRLNRLGSDPTNSYYMGSPLSMPPYQDVMGPSSSPQDNSPHCLYPPIIPLPPSTTLPSPIIPLPPSTTLPSPIIPIQYSSPPPPPMLPSLTPNPPPESSATSPPLYNNPSPPPPPPMPPFLTPNPPPESSATSPPLYPSPPGPVPNPPEYVPSPPSTVPGYVPSPPEHYVPGPPEFVPSPPVFQPPVVYPPPSVPPPPLAYSTGLWCVAKPTVPDPFIQEAMNYACGSGADCDSIQPNGSCYQPDTLIAHASFAFNSYWQRTKVAGGTCDFGATAMLITKDPSYDGCHFTSIAN